VRARTTVILAIVLALVIGVSVYVVAVELPSGHSTTASGSPATCAAPASGTGNSTVDGNWTTYHGDNSRSGYVPMSAITSVKSEWSGPTDLNGQVYAQPLVCGDSLYVATESDSVYAVNATTGAVEWTTNLGTPVPPSDLACAGDIDPSGITSTPVIDVTTRTLYVVAFLLGASNVSHVLFGLNVTSGAVTFRANADAPGAVVNAEQQRAGLALEDGYVYVPYGGLYGDCGQYHGWVVGIPIAGSGAVLSYQVPTMREGAIWGVAGFGIAANGDLYVATGNGASNTVYDYGDSVIELSPSLTVLGYFAPTNWVQLNENDQDLGSVAPTVLPDGDVFQIGKEGVGYLLSGTDLGGIGGQIYNASVCGGAYGGTARVGDSILVPCDNGLWDLNMGADSFSIAWQASTSNFDSGSPIVTGDLVWAVNINDADLLGFNLSNGVQAYSFPLAAVDHFISPAAAPGNLFVAGGDELYAFALG